MGNILKKYQQTGVVEIGTDKRRLDSPIHYTKLIAIDPVSQNVGVTIMHEVMQGVVMNPHERTFKIPFSNLTPEIRAAGKLFMDAIEVERMKRIEYKGSIEV